MNSKSALEAWETSLAVKSREETLISGHRGWRIRRNLDPDQKFPGMRHILLHTFAHVLIRELALQCGYNAASIRKESTQKIMQRKINLVCLFTQQRQILMALLEGLLNSEILKI